MCSPCKAVEASGWKVLIAYDFKREGCHRVCAHFFVPSPETYRDGGNHHAHGMSSVLKCLQVLDHVLMNVCMPHDAGGPCAELFDCGQFAIDEQKGYFEERAFGGQFRNVIATISKNSLVSINEATKKGLRGEVCYKYIHAMLLISIRPSKWNHIIIMSWTHIITSHRNDTRRC